MTKRRDTEKSVTLKRRQLASDDALPDVTTPGALRPEEISSDAPHGSIVLYMTKQNEAGWPYFETLESQREGWPGDTKNGLPGHCLFGGETNENEAGGSSGSGWDLEFNISQKMGTDVQGVSTSDLGASCATTGSTISDISLPPQNDEEEADEQQKDCQLWVDQFLSHGNSKSTGQHASLRLATWLISNDSIPDIEWLATGNATQEFVKQAKNFLVTLTQEPVTNMLGSSLPIAQLQKVIHISILLTEQIRKLDQFVKNDRDMDMDSS